MPNFGEIQQYLLGSWRMMTGRPDGVRMLDISADGFWNSFFAMVVALPALIAGWVTLTNTISPATITLAGRLSILLRLGAADLALWVLPLVAFVLVARPAGLSDKVAHYVVSNNWGTALMAWMMLPPRLLDMFVPAASEISSGISLGLFLLSLVLGWLLTDSALGKGPGVATAVWAATLALYYLLLRYLPPVLGLTLAAA